MELIPGIELGRDAVQIIGISALVSALIPQRIKKKAEDTPVVGWVFGAVFSIADALGANWGGARNQKTDK